jgi:hypothetical protein
MFPLFYVGGPISVLIENSNPDVVCDLSLGSIFGNDRGARTGLFTTPESRRTQPQSQTVLSMPEFSSAVARVY